MSKIETLSWKVFIRSFSGWEIEEYDIFQHGSFSKGVEKALKQYKKKLKEAGGEDAKKKDKEAIKEWFLSEVDRELAYYFWCKYEWECGITEIDPVAVNDGRRYAFLKVDVYRQVMMNKDRFHEYLAGALL